MQEEGRSSSWRENLSGLDLGGRVALSSATFVSLSLLTGFSSMPEGPPAGEALELSDEQWSASFELLVGGPIRLLRQLVPLMAEGGAILFIISSSVRQPIPGLDTSNVLRPGVAALVKRLARELAPRIRVNSIAPGRLDTERVRSLDQGRAERAGINRRARCWSSRRSGA
jgi:NAD(P)-dependent dehydrogenase (short-subunit alcohol dehydrogenase family)